MPSCFQEEEKNAFVMFTNKTCSLFCHIFTDGVRLARVPFLSFFLTKYMLIITVITALTINKYHNQEGKTHLQIETSLLSQYDFYIQNDIKKRISEINLDFLHGSYFFFSGTGYASEGEQRTEARRRAVSRAQWCCMHEWVSGRQCCTAVGKCMFSA